MSLGKTYNLLLIDEDQARAAAIADALASSRYQVHHLASPSVSLLKQVNQWQPDVIVIDIESPSRDMLESLGTLSHMNPLPIVLFSSEEDEHTINLSTRSGVSAYVVGDADPKRLRPILDAAVARFNEFQKLRDELDSTKHELEAQKLISRAKRLLMQHKGLPEDQAYKNIQQAAMQSSQKMDAVAQTIISIFADSMANE